MTDVFPTLSDVHKRAVQWCLSEDTGLSSKTIWAHMMTGEPPQRGSSYPRDPSDLGRCIRLLKCVPEWRARMPEMKKYGPQWSALVEKWHLLTAIYDVESARPDRTAPKTYAMMKSILARR